MALIFLNKLFHDKTSLFRFWHALLGKLHCIRQDWNSYSWQARGCRNKAFKNYGALGIL